MACEVEVLPATSGSWEDPTVYREPLGDGRHTGCVVGRFTSRSAAKRMKKKKEHTDASEKPRRSLESYLLAAQSRRKVEQFCWVHFRGWSLKWDTLAHIAASWDGFQSQGGSGPVRSRPVSPTGASGEVLMRS